MWGSLHYGGEVWEGRGGLAPYEFTCDYGVGLVFGKLLGRFEIFSFVKPPLKWVMTKRLSFGWTDSM